MPIAEAQLPADAVSAGFAGSSAGARLVFKGEARFFQTLRERVDRHFAGRPRRDDPRLYAKTALIAAWFLASYAGALTLEGLPQVLALLSHALSACALGLNIFHDAIHGSFSASERVNLGLARVACTLLGVNRKLWWYKHNVLHHRFTNVFRWDDDLETRDAFRMSPEQPWKPKYRFQHLFFPFLYSLTTLEWVFVKDFVQYFTLRINPYKEIPPFSRAEKAEFWASKAAYALYALALPLALLPAWKVAVGLVLFHVALSLPTALIFNLAHVMEEAAFPEPQPGSSELEDEWAAHQMRTTVNFALANRSLTWFAGGLNHQVEHHLFPQISHTHYPELSRIVQGTAAEFGLPYHACPTYSGALRSHFRILRELGRRPAAA